MLPGWELANAGDPECLGVFYGLVGQLELLSESRLVLVREAVCVGVLQGRGTVYKIRSIALLQVRLKSCHSAFCFVLPDVQAKY